MAIDDIYGLYLMKIHQEGAQDYCFDGINRTIDSINLSEDSQKHVLYKEITTFSIKALVTGMVLQYRYIEDTKTSRFPVSIASGGRVLPCEVMALSLKSRRVVVGGGCHGC